MHLKAFYQVLELLSEMLFSFPTSSLFANAGDDTPTREASEDEDVGNGGHQQQHFNPMSGGSPAPDSPDQRFPDNGPVDTLNPGGGLSEDEDSGSIAIGGLAGAKDPSDDDDKLPSFAPSPEEMSGGGGIDPGSTVDEDGIRESNSADQLETPDSQKSFDDDDAGPLF